MLEFRKFRLLVWQIERKKGEMSAYENVVAGKLRLKGRALDVRDAAIKKKKKNKNRYFPLHDQLTDGNNELVSNQANEGEFGEENERLTPAERRYMEQCQRIELQRLAKTAKKSHRDRIQEFNNYLANLTEHYDIPKVGPG
ncbi:PREDICTED: protein FAM32A-like isoform X1 [Erythranthe guttata]|uniref:protein FAM32A-like isoform X1 n=2 Tax=Erythranthe guttata TaxID=4155 RepID=UPI00064DA162|nr:PREDICTED: protein FAM32A-like isoform X1 [Erythranthe guttata]|eukprot:XP_012855972.1 PREDICTED: protein FAM32A-like isoform X1 [Erythranthe guttata]